MHSTAFPETTESTDGWKHVVDLCECASCQNVRATKQTTRRDQRVITINGDDGQSPLTITEHDFPLDFRIDAPSIEICERDVCVDLDRYQARMVRDAIAFLLGPDSVATTSAY